jgi:NitT/TauT family transport system substrate-binding protein
MMGNIRRVLSGALASSLAGILLATPWACAQAQGTTAPLTKVRVSLDWLFQGPAALFLCGVSKGYFRDEGLDVQIDAGNGGPGVVNRLASDTEDLGLADSGSLVEFLGNNPGAGVKGVFVLYDATPAVVVSLKGSGISKPKDLEGKVIGAPVFDAARKAFPVFAQANGLDMGRITWKTMDPSLRETMLVRHDVDAITGFLYSNYFSLLERGAKESDITYMKYSDYGATLYGSFVMANPKFLAAHPAAIRGFIRGMLKSVREVVQDPEGSIRYVAQRDPLINAPMETRRLKMAIDVVVKTPDTVANGLGAVDGPRLARATAAMAAALNLKNVPSTDAMFDGSFLPPMPERMIFKP